MTASSNAKTAETTAYDAVRAQPLTRIHGRPTRSDYERIKKEASDLASEVEDIVYNWARDPATGTEYGLLAEIIGEPEYNLLTGITWTQEREPDKYDPAITAATATHTRKRMEEDWEEYRQSWYIRKGFLRGMTMNMRDALDEAYYSQLKHVTTAYRNTTPLQILEHLDTRWCPLDVRAKKQLKAEFYAEWDSSIMHITAFGLKLNEEQQRLALLGIVISDDDKLQFYMEQIYSSNIFDKKEMVEWENKPIVIKDDFIEAKRYFENLVKDFETYSQNSGGTAAKQGYDSANMAADVGDELRRYIQAIATAAAADKESAANIGEASRAKDAQIATMTSQIKTLTDAVAALTASMANKENDAPKGNSGTREQRQRQTFFHVRNMGAYCWSHGHHPVGANHTSHTCTQKKQGHVDDATATNRKSGDNYWPPQHLVKNHQKEHESYKGKSAPSN